MRLSIGQVITGAIALILAMSVCEFYGKHLGDRGEFLRPTNALQTVNNALQFIFRSIGFFWVRGFDFGQALLMFLDLVIKVSKILHLSILKELWESFVSVIDQIAALATSPFYVVAGWLDAIRVSTNPALNWTFFMFGTFWLVIVLMEVKYDKFASRPPGDDPVCSRLQRNQ